MLKKLKAAGAAADAKDTSQAVLDSSRHIWLAGLGAFSRAQAEGTKMFEALVQQGQKLESKTRRVAADTAAAAHGAAKAKVDEVSKGVGGTWDKLEQVFEDRVARALSKLGVYTQNDVQRLAQRVDALSEAVNELIKASGGGAKTAGETAKKPARKPARKAAGTKPAARAKTMTAKARAGEETPDRRKRRRLPPDRMTPLRTGRRLRALRPVRRRDRRRCRGVSRG